MFLFVHVTAVEWLNSAYVINILVYFTAQQPISYEYIICKYHTVEYTRKCVSTKSPIPMSGHVPELLSWLSVAREKDASPNRWTRRVVQEALCNTTISRPYRAVWQTSPKECDITSLITDTNPSIGIRVMLLTCDTVQYLVSRVSWPVFGLYRCLRSRSYSMLIVDLSSSEETNGAAVCGQCQCMHKHCTAMTAFIYYLKMICRSFGLVGN